MNPTPTLFSFNKGRHQVAAIRLPEECAAEKCTNPVTIVITIVEAGRRLRLIGACETCAHFVKLGSGAGIASA